MPMVGELIYHQTRGRVAPCGGTRHVRWQRAADVTGDGCGAMRTIAGLVLCLAFCTRAAGAQTPTQPPPAEAQYDVNALAKQTQNPVADLTAVPLQFNFNSGGDLEDRSLFLLNFQPVIPFKATANWNVIARSIVPIESVPGPDATRYSGIGDMQTQLFITPAKSGSFVWGVGPTLSFPTATAASSETGTWALGPSAVVVKMAGPWVLGGLISQLWPLHDAAGDPETDLFTLQPFVNYNLGHGWALAFAPIMTANWNAAEGNQWTVPLGFGISKTAIFNRRPVSLGAQYYYNVERPDGAPGEQLRFLVSFLFPR